MKNTARRIRRMRREKKLKARRRRLLKRTGALLCALMIIAAAGANLLTSASAGGAETEYRTVTVAKGDTLWDIAAANNPRRRDIRSVVDDIMTVNNMAVSRICAGDVISVPIYR